MMLGHELSPHENRATEEKSHWLKFQHVKQLANLVVGRSRQDNSCYERLTANGCMVPNQVLGGYGRTRMR